MNRLIDVVRPKHLFPEAPTLRFRPENSVCACERKLKVGKTISRRVATMDIGEFIAHETKLCCDSCEETFVSEELLRLAPPKCKFGYDVMVHVGKALFMRHRTSREVAAELADNNVTVSASEIDVLGKMFIVYLAIAHRQSSERIKEAMRLNGGYMLHLDGTFDGRGPMS